MAERRKAHPEVEVEETPEVTPDEVTDDNANPELAEHVKRLVELHFDHVVQELTQRISDLELLVGQPEGAVRIYAPGDPAPAYPVPDYASTAEQGGGGVPWYQSPGGI